MDIKRKTYTDSGIGKTTVWEECSSKEWDKLKENEREFIDFGAGYTMARKTEIFH